MGVNAMEPNYNQGTSLTVEGFNSFLSKVFLWMFAGLLTTAASALFVLSTPNLIRALYTNQFLFFGLIIGEFALVAVLSRNALKYNLSTTIGLFLLYSLVNGITLSVVLLPYAGTTITTAFVISASIFAVMALYGYFTKTDLSPFKTFFMVAIGGIIIASLVNIFMGSETISFVVSVIGVVIFAGLTSYDMQKMKSLYAYSVNSGGTMEGNIAVTGALTLYLDFINMFLFVLRLLGRRR